ncbi:MAG TPA: LysR family transcriptional regulator [Caulobacteraceae bacterium]|jgi:molybdate transport repressor ModE-like protein|nr:LysR family transcriptional regulator [Caulobacteraceae bacterium]
MKRPPDWDLYQSLHAVLRAGSLSAAARDLGLSQPTVGRHIEQLENLLGLPLFTRSPQGLRPTEFARSLAPALDTMASSAQAALREASGEADAVAGVIRLAASEVAGAEVLPPLLTDFHEQHPDAVIELTLSNRAEDLLHREADIAVRMMRPTQAGLLARRVGVIGGGLYAHRRYLQRHGEPLVLDAPGHVAVGFDRDAAAVRAITNAHPVLTRELFSFRSDSDLAQLAAVRAGFGIGGIQHGIARRDPNLVHVLDQAFNFQLEVWVVMHEDLKASRRMRLMFDHLVAGLADYIKTSRG